MTDPTDVFYEPPKRDWTRFWEYIAMAIFIIGFWYTVWTLLF